VGNKPTTSGKAPRPIKAAEMATAATGLPPHGDRTTGDGAMMSHPPASAFGQRGVLPASGAGGILQLVTTWVQQSWTSGANGAALVANRETKNAQRWQITIAGRHSLTAGRTQAAGSTAQLPVGSAFLTVRNVLLAFWPRAVMVPMHTTMIAHDLCVAPSVDSASARTRRSSLLVGMCLTIHWTA
jgi:hypothetical protein